MKAKASPEKPYAFSFAIVRSWFMVSTVLERSINNAETHSPLSIALFHFSNITTKEFCVPGDFLKPVIVGNLFLNDSVENVRCMW